MVYIIFTDFKNIHIDITKTSSIKAFANDLIKAKQYLKELLLNYYPNQISHGIIILYESDILTDPFSKLTPSQKIIYTLICNKGEFQENIPIPIVNISNINNLQSNLAINLQLNKIQTCCIN